MVDAKQPAYHGLLSQWHTGGNNQRGQAHSDEDLWLDWSAGSWYVGWQTPFCLEY